ncbi:hypothetical protein A3Q56_04354 [Intoshia linei]|uniref:N-acetyltransferase domain-containing protein n=1 Tax=Intoshia linei TaxID=1819745 RepID=A0A177B2S4_9BILA|nr:hypothetical protein A3Q56_04354 [Intoshia linei]
MKILALHENWEYVYQTACFLSSEWNINFDKRIEKLHLSNNKSPYNCIIINEQEIYENAHTDDYGNDIKCTYKIVAHGRYCLLDTFKTSCIIESILVKKSYRNQGLGRQIMKSLIEIIRCKGCSDVYIATYDQQNFYKKINFIECESFKTINYIIKNKTVCVLITPKYYKNVLSNRTWMKYNI